MSLVWPTSEQEVVLTEPRLHALVIGVADYPHLLGGSGRLAEEPLGLSKITTPYHTALDIVNWLYNNYNNSDCALGSIEALLSPLSPIPAIPGSPNTEAATMLAIERSFNKWFTRASGNKDNIAFFYFCGHGLKKFYQYILPEDFGDPTHRDRWKNCIDFDALRLGMRSCKAQTQLFFVDACRETPYGMLTQHNVTGARLCTSDITDAVNCSATYYATGDGKRAFGPSDANTYFSQALLSCLNGVGAVKRMGKWVVDTHSLSGALGQAMAQLAGRHNLPLTCNPDVSGLARIHESSEARVIAVVQCSSKKASDIADITLRKGSVIHQSAMGQPKPIIEEVAAGDWDIEVIFPGGEYPAFPAELHTLMPPVFEGVPIP